MASYYTLVVGRDILKNFPAIGTGSNKITADDLLKSELMAFNEINGHLAQAYDISTWNGVDIPLQVRDVAQILGSAYAWEMVAGMDTIEPLNGGSSLFQHAQERITRIKRGEEQLIDASGGLVARILVGGTIGSLP